MFGISRILFIVVLILFCACTKEDTDSCLMDHTNLINFSLDKNNDLEFSRATSFDCKEYVDAKVLRSAISSDTLVLNVYKAEQFGSMSRSAVSTKDNLTSFGVYASWTKGNSSTETFFSNLKITRDATTGQCTSEKDYYWPGDAYTLQFMGVAPYNPEGLTVNQNIGLPESLNYIVPDEATKQSDLMLVTTPVYQGGYNGTVPIVFKHICTAINVKVGTVPSGVIQSITLKNIPYAGTYTINNGIWNLGDDKTDFLLDFAGSSDAYITIGTETNNPLINDESATFMMIPQTLPDGAEMEIEFKHSNTGKVETLVTSLAGMVWPKGKALNYVLDITPDYILDFTIEEAEMQDAHYVMMPVTIKSKFLQDGWTLSATTTDDSSVTFREEKTVLQEQGYWIVDDRGVEELQSSLEGDEVTVWAFLEENIEPTNREITLYLKPSGDQYANREAKTLTVQQLSPSWNGDVGCERIEDGEYPWGFKWDNTMKITYSFSGGIGNWWTRLRIQWYIRRLDYDYISTTTSWGAIKSATIDFSKLNTSKTDVAKSQTDGLKNTKDLYNFKGVSDVSDFMAQLESWGGTPDKTLPTNPTEFAARACAMKNRYKKVQEESEGELIDLPVLDDDDFVWYLPAKNEIVNIIDAEYPMSGSYWTSTSEPNGEDEAYMFTVGGNTVLKPRNEGYKVRAIRKRN